MRLVIEPAIESEAQSFNNPLVVTLEEKNLVIEQSLGDCGYSLYKLTIDSNNCFTMEDMAGMWRDETNQQGWVGSILDYIEGKLGSLS